LPPHHLNFQIIFFHAVFDNYGMLDGLPCPGGLELEAFLCIFSTGWSGDIAFRQRHSPLTLLLLLPLVAPFLSGDPVQVEMVQYFYFWGGFLWILFQ
jgi:hypothetical protein